MNIIYVLVYIVFVVIVYQMISIYLINRKTKNIINLNSINIISSNKYLLTYKERIEKRLFDLDYPYKLTYKKYIQIKYFLSILVFLISLINYRTILIPLILFIIIFLIPDIFIKNYERKENLKIIEELRTINSNLILYLTAYNSLKDALKLVAKDVIYDRLKREFSIFAYNYEAYKFDIKLASKRLLSKFKSQELNMFISILIQSEKDGDLISNLEKFDLTLELGFFKCLKRKSSTRILYVALGTILILISIAAITMYPILVQVIDNLHTIFS